MALEMKFVKTQSLWFVTDGLEISRVNPAKYNLLPALPAERGALERAVFPPRPQSPSLV